MNIILIEIGVLCLVFSILLFFLPFVLLSLSTFFNRIFSVDKTVIKLRVGIGICLILVSFFLFFTAYVLAKT